MKSILLINCFSLILNLSGCMQHVTYTFWVENNADYDIVLHYKFFEAKHTYPDTLFKIEVPADRYLITSHSIGKANYLIEKLEDVIQKMPNDTLSFFFIHADTLNNYPLEIVQRDYKILRRYDLSSQDIITLRNQHGNLSIIPYPPNEKMKDMKMYPPYGSE